MQKLSIRLSSIEDVREFVNIVSKYESDVDLQSGRYVVDAKSIMGIFSLDLLSPIEMTIYSDDSGKLLEEVSKYKI